MDIAIEFREVGYAGDGGVAIDGVSFRVARGEVAGLLGPDGAGKSTVLRLAAGDLAPTAGSVRLDGTEAEAPALLVDDGVRGDARSSIEAGRARGATVLLATRDADFARRTCDRVLLIVAGRLVADVPVAGESGLAGEAFYVVEVQGRLDARRAAYFDGLDVRAGEGGTTVVSGRVVDQAALHGLLERIRDLGLPLVSVRRSAPDLETLLARSLRG